MEAPVPASALIHSATLVSAGIYLTLRFNFCFEYSPNLFLLFQIVTASTAFYGAAIASFQTDVKKVLAYSTISHCGMLMYSITLGAPHVTIFYLFAHGFFKSLNFLCVGNFVQYANNYQDVSRMGYFAKNFAFERFFLTICIFNLSSAPFFLAFFSKHWLINSAHYNSVVALVSVSMVFSAAFCGFFYSSKLFYESLLSKKRAHYSVYNERAAVNSRDNASAYADVNARANRLGVFSMCLLFVAAVAILLYLFAQTIYPIC